MSRYYVEITETRGASVTVSVPDGITHSQALRLIRAWAEVQGDLCDGAYQVAGVDLTDAPPDPDYADEDCYYLDGAGHEVGRPDPPEPPPRPPGDGEWIEWRGRKWATNGHGLWREDAPPPELAGWYRADRWADPAAGIEAEIKRETSCTIPLDAGREEEQADQWDHWPLVRLRGSGVSRRFDARYVATLADCVAFCGPAVEDFTMFYRCGEVVAYVMSCREVPRV